MDKVGDLLDQLGLAQYCAAFEENDIDSSLIGDLTADDLKEIGVRSLGHRKKLLAAFRARAGWAEATHPAPDDEAELRDVTILFADLTGYSKLSLELDAERIHEILSTFYARFNDVVERLGGTVARHIGDCVMAVFGAPVSYGNDSERALRASVDLHRTMEEISCSFARELTVHVGAAVGTVLFSRQGYGQLRDRDFTVTGDTVNLASRLSDQAAAGETLIDERIFLSLSHKIECDAPTSLEVKGYADPVLAHRLVGFREGARPGRLVGRDREMAVFAEAIAACARRESGKTLYVCGDAGIGKTRLLQEAVAVARQAGFATHAAQILDFGLGDRQNPLNQLARSLCGLADGVTPEAVGQTVARLREDGVLSEVTAIFVTSMLGGTLDQAMTTTLSAMSEDARADGRTEALRQVLRHAAMRQPLLLLIEDLHWADARMLPWLDLLVEESRAQPILAVMTSRPEGVLAEREIAPIDSDARVRRMDLAPLAPGTAVELARATAHVTDARVAECVRRAQGNPLFLIQILAHATDTADAVPSSIQSLIQARFDRLDATDRRILQAAAILGQRFTMESVIRIANVRVYGAETLVRAALITPVEEGYLFAHALIRDAILRTILRRDLAMLHRAAAEWFRTRDAVLHAQHLAAARDPAAARAFLVAALAARDGFRKADALALAVSGLETGPEPALCGALLRLQGDMLRETGQVEASVAAFQAAEDTAQTPRESCRSMIGRVAAMRILDRIDEAYGVLDRAQVLAEADDLAVELSEIHYLRGSLHFPRSNLDGCRAEHQLSLDYARRAGEPRREALALSGLGDAAYARGRMFTAHRAIGQCLDLCRAHGFGDVESANLFMLATVEIYMNKTAQALENALRSADLADSLGTHRPEIVSRLTAGWILISMARFEEAQAQIARGLALADELGARRFKPFLQEAAARIDFYRGDRESAAITAEAAFSQLSEVGAESFIGPWVLSTVALTAPDGTRRRDALADGARLLAAGCVGHNHFRFHRGAMQACLNAGDFDAAAGYAEALERFTAKEPTPWSAFHIDRTRAIVAVARDGADPVRLSAIAERARAAGLLNALAGLAERPLDTVQT